MLLLFVFSVVFLFLFYLMSVYLFQVVLRTEKHLRLHHGSFGRALGARVP